MDGRGDSGADTVRAPAAGGSRPWWSRTGSETCTLCAGTFDLEVEVRCHECDAPVCPFCVVEVETTAALRCTACSPEGP